MIFQSTFKLVNCWWERWFTFTRVSVPGNSAFIDESSFSWVSFDFRWVLPTSFVGWVVTYPVESCYTRWEGQGPPGTYKPWFLSGNPFWTQGSSIPESQTPLLLGSVCWHWEYFYLLCFGGYSACSDIYLQHITIQHHSTPEKVKWVTGTRYKFNGWQLAKTKKSISWHVPVMKFIGIKQLV